MMMGVGRSMMRGHRVVTGATVVAASIGLLATVARAAPNDFEVQASAGAGPKIGEKFEKGARLVLPAGATVTLLDRTGTAVRTRQCGGVYDGPVEQCTAPKSGTGPAVGGATRGIR